MVGAASTLAAATLGVSLVSGFKDSKVELLALLVSAIITIAIVGALMLFQKKKPPASSSTQPMALPIAPATTMRAPTKTKLASTNSTTLSEEQQAALLILEYTNNYRASKGIAALKWQPYIADLAVKHTENMAKGIVPLSHAGFSITDAQWPIPRALLIVDKLGATGAAENVAYNYEPLIITAAKKVTEQWIGSAGHETNMVNPKFNYMGVAVVRGPGKQIFYTQEFGQINNSNNN